MGERFYQAQAEYIKEYNKELKQAGTKAQILEKILILDPNTTDETKKLLKPQLLAHLTTLENTPMAMTDEVKDELIKDYLAAEPTPENSTEVIKELAEQYEQTVNSIRMTLINAKVYVKTAVAKPAAKAGATGEGTKRVSKEDQLNALREALKNADVEIDEDVISKLTGKVATYFAGAIKAAQG
jgi:hypothetical protein